MELPSEPSTSPHDNIATLAEDGDVTFGRGWREGKDGRRDGFLIVRPTSAQRAPATLDRFAHEYALRGDLDSTWAVRPLQLLHEGDRTSLILEDPGGTLLGSLMGTPMEVAAFLRIAVGIAAVLGKAHQRGLVHKDVKPDNILVNTQTGEVRLTGFGNATRLSRERQSVKPPEFIGGTLAYMAPEQTGRMNRSVDSRSDLYSFGVTLYQMVTGGLPFSASDPMEWVHCHIARKPVPPDAQLDTIPTAISAIIMKLLAKTAEERYQTAAGVEHDLRQCLKKLAQGPLDDFALGRKDTPDRLMIPEKLYGREAEVETLLGSFDRMVTSGAPELVLVSGYSGIGKSSVVNEMHKALVPPRGLFAAGKFDQYKRNIPYATLAQALQSLVRLLLGRNNAELNGWRDALAAALSPNGGLMTDLVPELKLILGEQEPVAELPASDAQRRFQLVLRRFIGVFARAEHPLALFLDDLQWLDAATLHLLEDLFVQEGGVTHLLVIGAYRDNEVDASHPLARSLSRIRATRPSSVQEIRLSTLDGRHVSQLLADAFSCDTRSVGGLAELLLQKTDGNPFFVSQFLSTLTDEGLIAFDPVQSRWSWDLKRIDAKAYSDNVADLMIGKLVRLSAVAQQALQHMACLGNIATVATLATVRDTTDVELHASLAEARRQELVVLVEGSYRFAHDRVHEAAYALIPSERRAALHLVIGKKLVAHTPPEDVSEAVFEIVNQLNRASSLMTAQDDREQLAEFNLLAGRRAQASSAYVSALGYLTTGAAFLAEDSWHRRRELAFALELATAHCEFASGMIAEAEKRLRRLSLRAGTTEERVAIASLQIDLYQAMDRNGDAVSVGLEALQHLGIKIPEHPTDADARQAYDRIWTGLGSRAIEDLVDLPLASSPDALAALDLLIRVGVPGHHFRSIHLLAVVVCTAVRLGLERGHSDASCIAYAQMGFLAGPVFGQFDAGYRFGRLGCDLAERPGLQRFQGRVFEAFGFIMGWTQHVRKGRPFLLRAFELASQSGEVSYAGYACAQINTNYLLVGDPLADAQEQAENGLAFARRVGLGTAEGWIVGQLGLIRSLGGLTARFGAFDDDDFREADFEHNLASNSALTFPRFWYYIRKLQARFYAGEYEDALEAASVAQPLLQNYAFVLECVEYYFYAALCHAAVHNSAPRDRQNYHREMVTKGLEKLEVWARHCPENFTNRAALVSAELARLDGRDADAMTLYEWAIRSAREQGFVQNEGLAHEVAARFYSARGAETSANAHLRRARRCFLRWGAHGKVKQLDRLYPNLTGPELQDPAAALPSALQRLDVGTVVKASQAVSGEIELPKLIDRLMTIVLENAGADRGLLILPRGDEYLVRAEARTTDDRAEVTLRQEPLKPASGPESLIRYVIRTHESVILDDVSTPNLFSADDYFALRQPRSILCFPLIKQRELIGVLYLENSLAPHVFTADRLAILELLGAQAAISLENARLFSDLSDREAKVRRLVDSNIIGILIIDLEGQILEANDAFLTMVGYDREDLSTGRMRWTDSPSVWRESDPERAEQIRTTGSLPPFEKEYFRKDGSRVPVLIGVARIGETNQAVAFVIDLSDRKQAEAELAHANRIATMGQLTASIAHEVNQPIAALLLNAGTALRWLGRQPPDLEQARRSVDRIIGDGKRVADIVGRVHGLSKKAPMQKAPLDINEAILEVISLTGAVVSNHEASVKTQLAEELATISGDKVQFQQVILNLIMNAIEAMSETQDRSRELLIRTETAEVGSILVAVSDSGPGLLQVGPDRIFDAFYTTKASGLGIGLSICRSIVEAHGGRLWAEANEPKGLVFYIKLPVAVL